MSTNPFMQPVDLSTGQLITTSNPGNQFLAPYAIPAGTTSNGGGFLGSDGFLSKAAETAVDLFGLYGSVELQKAQIENAGSDRGDPVIVASQTRAGFLPSMVQDFSVPVYVIGGLAAVGILAAITIAATRK